MSGYRRVRLLATISGAYGNYDMGDVLSLPFEDAESLVRQGYAADVDAPIETGSVQAAERAVTVSRRLDPTRRTV